MPSRRAETTYCRARLAPFSRVDCASFPSMGSPLPVMVLLEPLFAANSTWRSTSKPYFSLSSVELAHRNLGFARDDQNTIRHDSSIFLSTEETRSAQPAFLIWYSTVRIYFPCPGRIRHVGPIWPYGFPASGMNRAYLLSSCAQSLSWSCPVLVLTLTSVTVMPLAPIMISISPITSAKRYKHCCQYHSWHNDSIHLSHLCSNLSPCLFNRSISILFVRFGQAPFPVPDLRHFLAEFNDRTTICILHAMFPLVSVMSPFVLNIKYIF